MKTRLFTALLAIGIAAFSMSCITSGYAQRATAKNNDLSVDFVDYLVNNTFTAQYEFKSTSTTSFLIRAEYVTKNTGIQTGVTSALGVGAGWRFYILDSRALSGFSIAPIVDLFFFKNTILSRNDIIFALGADAGYKFFFDQFTVEPTIGGRIGFAPSNLPPGENTYSGLYPVISVYFGWAW